MKSCVELLRSCGINILVVFSDIPVFRLDDKLPTTLKHRTRNTIIVEICDEKMANMWHKTAKIYGLLSFIFAHG